MNEHNLWDSVKHPTGLADMVHVGWMQRLLSSAEWSGFPGPEPDLVAHGQMRVGPHARKIFEEFAELGLRYAGERQIASRGRSGFGLSMKFLLSGKRRVLICAWPFVVLRLMPGSTR